MLPTLHWAKSSEAVIDTLSKLQGFNVEQDGTLESSEICWRKMVGVDDADRDLKIKFDQKWGWVSGNTAQEHLKRDRQQNPSGDLSNNIHTIIFFLVKKLDLRHQVVSIDTAWLDYATLQPPMLGLDRIGSPVGLPFP
jgi:hypothetical protein